MGFFGLFRQLDINQGIKNYRSVSGAVLIDVRTTQEYRDGHIPGSKNVPLQTIKDIISVVDNKNTALYIYCQSGSRSRQATNILQQMGYTNVTNIGGFSMYSGKVER